MNFTLCHLDDHLLIVNKPAGLLSVPGRGPDKADCVAARVQAVYSDALVVHRLDMATSGLLLFARGLDMQRALSRLFETRQVHKEYLADVAGELPEQGSIDLPLIADWPNRPRQQVDWTHGKPSLTHYQRLSYDPVQDISRVLLLPVTGRSHQLRVHLSAIGHPILGDIFYDGRPATRLHLHASRLSLPHPVTSEGLEVQSPADF